MAAWLILCPLVQVCFLRNRKRWLTSEPWKDGCRHHLSSTLPHLQESCSMNEQISALPLNEVGLTFSTSALIVITADGTVIWSIWWRKKDSVRRDSWDLISFSFRWSCGNRLSCLVAIRSQLWQKFFSFYCRSVISVMSGCGSCFSLQRRRGVK